MRNRLPPPVLPFLLFVAGLTTGHGQDVLSRRPQNPDALADERREVAGWTDTRGVPYLYEGELEDVGPQYLLVPGREKHQWLRLLLDSQWYYTSNPTLANDDDRVGTDLWISTLEGRVVSPSRDLGGGELTASAGGYAQTYLYGTLAGPDEPVGGVAMDENNFAGLTAFAELDYATGPWRLGAGLRYTRLSNLEGDDGFFREWVPSWSATYLIPTGRASLASLGYDGAWHGTENETFNLQRDDLNDRWAHNLTAAWTWLMCPGWYLQPFAGIGYDTYTNGPDREDWTPIAGASVIFQPSERIAARLFATYQSRTSSGAGIEDYEQVNAGIGGSLRLRF